MDDIFYKAISYYECCIELLLVNFTAQLPFLI